MSIAKYLSGLTKRITTRTCYKEYNLSLYILVYTGYHHDEVISDFKRKDVEIDEHRAYSTDTRHHKT